MGIYTTGELHKVADKVLEAIKTVPDTEKMSVSAGNWVGLGSLESHIHKQRKTTKFYIDNETLLLAVGLLIGRNDIECHRAHGRGVGYFFIVRPTQEDLS